MNRKYEVDCGTRGKHIVSARTRRQAVAWLVAKFAVDDFLMDVEFDSDEVLGWSVKEVSK